MAIENEAALGDGSLEISKRPEVPVGERLVQSRPEVLGQLKLGRVPGQVDEPDPIRHSQIRFGVPTGVVEPEHDDAIRPAPASRANSANSAAKTAWTPRSRCTEGLA